MVRVVTRERPLEERAIGRIFDFLGVVRLPPMAPRASHVRPYTTEMARREWQFLHDAFEFEIHALERMFGWDCSDWLQPRVGTDTNR